MNNNSFKSHKFEHDSVKEKLNEKFIIKPSLFGIKDFYYNGTGKDVKICLLGTGSPDHAAIKNIAHLVNMGNTKTYKDESGQSCIASGIIASDDDNIVGLAPGAHLYFGKINNDDGTIDENSMAAGIIWGIVAQVNIIVLSDASTQNFAVVDNAIKKAVDCGVIIISDGTITNTMYPQSYDNVISVSDGFDVNQNSIVLPSDLGFVWSTFLGQKYTKVHASKFSAAFVAGIAAILYEHNREKDPSNNCHSGILKQIKDCLAK